jgi:hypothetical protein
LLLVSLVLVSMPASSTPRRGSVEIRLQYCGLIAELSKLLHAGIPKEADFPEIVFSHRELQFAGRLFISPAEVVLSVVG